jgi:hypothetical protein
MGKRWVAEKGIQWTRRESIIRWGVVGFVLVLCLLVLWFSFTEEFGRNQLEVGADLTLPVSDLLRPGNSSCFRIPLTPSPQLNSPFNAEKMASFVSRLRRAGGAGSFITMTGSASSFAVAVAITWNSRTRERNPITR